MGELLRLNGHACARACVTMWADAVCTRTCLRACVWDFVLRVRDKHSCHWVLASAESRANSLLDMWYLRIRTLKPRAGKRVCLFVCKPKDFATKPDDQHLHQSFYQSLVLMLIVLWQTNVFLNCSWAAESLCNSSFLQRVQLVHVKYSLCSQSCRVTDHLGNNQPLSALTVCTELFLWRVVINFWHFCEP